MPLSWIKRPKSPASVDELVAAGKYDQAVVRLRQQFSERYPSTEERQRYAEVLVLAGRRGEAVPVLLGIADEQERYGFPEKALDALHRAAEIDPEQAEVKERLSSIRNPPRPGSTKEAPSPADPPAAADTWGAALDVAFTPDATSEGPLEFEALDAEEAVSPSPDASPSPGDESQPEIPETAVDHAGPRADGDELVAVGGPAGGGAGAEPATELAPARAQSGGPANPDEGEITAQSLWVDPEVAKAPGTTAADEGEITAQSLHVDPAVFGEADPEQAVDEGEITARSLLVDPSVLVPAQSEGKKEDEGEITARSLLVDPSVFAAAGPGTEEQDPGEETATSLPVVSRVAGEEEPGPAAPLLLLPEDELEPEEDLNAEEVEELTAEGQHDAGAGEPEPRTDPRGLPTGGTNPPRVPPSELVDPPKADVAREADPLGTTSPITELAPLLTEEDLQVALTADAQALLAGPPTRDEPGSLDDDEHLQELLAIDARALLSRSPTADRPAAVADGNLDELLTTDARALLADGPRPDGRAAVTASGDSRGEPLPGDHVPEAGGGAAPAPDAPRDVPSPTAESHRGEATGDQHPPPAVHPDETHLFLSEEDLFSALTEGPRPPSNGNGHGSGTRGEAAALAARPASPVEEQAEGAGEEQGHQLAS